MLTSPTPINTKPPGGDPPEVTTVEASSLGRGAPGAVTLVIDPDHSPGFNSRPKPMRNSQGAEAQAHTGGGRVWPCSEFYKCGRHPSVRCPSPAAQCGKPPPDRPAD